MNISNSKTNCNDSRSVPLIGTGSARGYSLVEMMVVWGVVGLLAAIAAPSLMTLGSTSLSNAGDSFKAQLDLAGAKAKTQNTGVRLVIVRDWPGNRSAENKSYSLWRWQARDRKYVPEGQWMSLPTGIVFEPEFPEYVADSEYAESDPSTIHARDWADGSVEIDGQPVKVSYLEFRPNGSVKGAERGLEPNFAVVPVEGQVREGRIYRTGPIGNRSYIKDADPDIVADNASSGGGSSSGSGEQPPLNWVHVNVNAVTGLARVERPEP